ncbi:immunoglobulin-like domain-containing protein [Aquimarina sp. RZ0]|uniref:immunoglobulin-like domain-containing protein n=1 Tax=Aquimarina sp. RZ0 TaxID=2607730 RepID=UPI0011F09BEC|nr:immunoglobulin-like domain-containing protein [Aquimarina sp. RZ0]KAA1246129.1 DUF5011 domain-containing protein [Aquimarina sp. RZ0]
MKKNYKYSLVGVLLLSLVISCTKEINDDVISFFKVEFTETSLDAFLEIPKETNFEISKGEQSVNSGDYQIKYNITEGSGIYLLNSIAIEEDEYVDLTGGPQFTIEYVASVIGLNNVTITIKDRKKNTEEEIDLVYDVTDTAFTFDVVPSSLSTFIGGVVDIDISITEISSSDYDVKLEFLSAPPSSITGAGDIIIDGEVVDTDLVNVLQSGDVSWQFRGTSIGVVNILFTVTNNFEVMTEKTIRIGVGPPPLFNLNISLETPDVNMEINNPANINFSIDENFGRDTTYTMEYTTSNEGTLTIGGTEYAQGDIISIMRGDTSGQYVGTQEGVHELVFTVTNSNIVPVVRMATVSITYEEDTVAPVITLTGDNPQIIQLGDSYAELGATVDDGSPLDIDTSDVDTDTVGEYTVRYSATDASGNTGQNTRTVTVVDNTVISFDRTTGKLIGPSGATVTITMNSGGFGSGNAILNIGSIAVLRTCWELPDDVDCLVSVDDTNPLDDEAAYEFPMPAGDEILLTGSHNIIGTVTQNTTRVIINVNGNEVFNNTMTDGNGIPQ